MRAVIQRTYNDAEVRVSGNIVGHIKKGLIVYLAIEEQDDKTDIEWMTRKIINMRIFNDEAQKMNKSVLDIGGEILIISQFTLYASTKKGNRPSFIRSAKPEFAENMYHQFCNYMNSNYDTKIEMGQFGADMKIDYINDGPITIFLDSKNRE